ncbi:peptide ABC transporter permease [Acidianus sulfidivorans JP7]|uniref:Peptide ABC transporter permease n=1 Tax=Acidianus sulfidivorans JP7 TaxID=619593 RepID=A0A2U9IJP2_9CREN|nr:peptide ABC transporter permease [Acidianus sulfidivorans]AWR96261.1 peptide ABC transporter permease [Acidianus sulfidivorans JP7]
MKVRIIIFFIIFIIFSVFFSFYPLPSGKPLTPPNLNYPLGTYINGANMINVNAKANVNTLIFGSVVGLIEVSLSLFYGVFAGSSRFRSLLVRFLDSINTIPRIPFLLSIALFYGTPTGKGLIGNFFIIALTVGLTGWTYYARQISEIVYANYSLLKSDEYRLLYSKNFSLFNSLFIPSFYFFIVKNIWKNSLKFFIPAMLDGISTFTAMGVIGGVGDPNYPTLTTLLITSRSLLPDYWLFLIPAAFRGVLLILLISLSK